MASNADSKANAMISGEEAKEQESKKKASSELVEDLDDRMEELRDRIELCDRLLKDFVNLRGVLADKNFGDQMIESIQQDPSH